VFVDLFVTFWKCHISGGLFGSYGSGKLRNTHTDGLLRRLQSVQNAAARLITGTRRCEHITPALRQLPVRQCIQYKLASLAFCALLGLAPDYLAGDCLLVADSGRRSLRSAERRVCTVPCQNNAFGDRSFAAAGPRAWNELPFSLRDTGLLLTTFNAHLKTYLLIFHSV